ncbi:hypothetical protein BDZ89DRAFT_568386 [Hymenopellis radicata]|nr:hypothetical protein BDZ89DRAFT_568386 [Hymenopellis radicata]
MAKFPPSLLSAFEPRYIHHFSCINMPASYRYVYTPLGLSVQVLVLLSPRSSFNTFVFRIGVTTHRTRASTTSSNPCIFPCSSPSFLAHSSRSHVCRRNTTRSPPVNVLESNSLTLCVANILPTRPCSGSLPKRAASPTPIPSEPQPKRSRAVSPDPHDQYIHKLKLLVARSR